MPWQIQGSDIGEVEDMLKKPHSDEKPEIPSMPEDEEGAFSEEIETWGRMVWKRFRRHRLAMTGLVVIVILGLSAIAAPILAPYSPDELRLDLVPEGQPLGPSLQHPFGTDALGRDYLSRAIYGARVSLSVGIVAVGISVLIGTAAGAVAGYYGGLVDSVICRVIDVLQCIPTFFLILSVNAYLKPNITNVMVVIGVFGWMGVARLVRGQFLSLREQEFIEAARSMGMKDSRVIFRHLLPNALAPLVVSATMGVASAILTESSLSYLGMGVQEPTASWGSMLRVSQSYLLSAPWLAIFPGLLISITVLCLNFVGDGLRDAIDPRLKQ
jgi:peptide/nickel transport system permease protein